MSQVDFYSMLSGLGDTIQSARKERQQQQILQARKGAFSDFTALDPASPDYGKQALGVAQKLGSVGDQEGALKFLTLAQTAADKAHTYQREGVLDQRDARDYDLRAKQANKDKFAIKEIADPNTGQTTLVRVNTEGAEGPINTGAPASQPLNPYAYGKQNEGQSKDSGYANRMFDAEKTLRDPKVVEAGMSKSQTAIEGIPLVPDSIKNWAHSPEYQKYDQAQRNMINAILRRESGAAISQGEFDNAYKQYIPRFGDSPEKIAEKQKNRQAAIAGIAGGGGQSYRPPYTFGPNGELVETGNPKQGATPQAKPASAVAAPSGAVAALKKDPRLAAQFDAKYGQGAAKAALGGGEE